MKSTQNNWEEWVRTLAKSTNTNDVELLIAKIKVLTRSVEEKARQGGYDEGYAQAASDEARIIPIPQ